MFSYRAGRERNLANSFPTTFVTVHIVEEEGR